MAAPHEVIGAVAAAISAVVAVAAASIAPRAARASEQASAHALESDRRNSLREASALANSVVMEVQRINTRALEMQRLVRRSSPSLDSSVAAKVEQAQSVLVQLLAMGEEMSMDARLFTGGAHSLKDAPLEDIERIRVRMAERSGWIRTANESLDHWNQQLARALGAQ